MIDPATGWFEVAAMKDRTSETAMKVMDDVWFSRYPRPEMIGFDNGSEYKNVFQEMIQNYGLKAKPTTAWNPQSNGIVERVHQVLNDGLRTFELENRELDENDPWTPFLSSVAYAIRSTYHTTLGATPAQLVFNRDMILPIQMKFDWELIREQRQRIMTKSNARENASRLPHEYKVGDKVLLAKPGMLRKLSVPRTGPYLVQAVYANGTLRIKRGAVSERVNIRRVTPFIEVPP
jgi:transposase InsO family protein